MDDNFFAPINVVVPVDCSDLVLYSEPAEDGSRRIFYDLICLHNTYAQTVKVGLERAEAMDDHDARLFYSGQAHMLAAIAESVRTMQVEAMVNGE